MLTAFLIDDDMAFQVHLKELLAKDHADVKITGTYSQPEDAVIALQQNPPDVVFLDVEMPGLTGVELLEHFPQRSFAVVFTTSHDKYALSAIKKEALDYLLKPVNRVELAGALAKVKNNIPVRKMAQGSVTQSPKIPLHSAEGITLVEVKQIVYCEADNNYTTLYLADNKKTVVTRGISDIETQLQPHGFFKPHKSYLVNLNHIARVMKTDGGFIVMNTGAEIPVARGRKEELMLLIENLG